MTKVRDPKTGAMIRWSGHPQAPGYAMPLSAAIDGRAAGRRWAVPEHPDVAVLFDGKIAVAAASWGALGMQLYLFDATTLELSSLLNMGQLSTGVGSVEERQIPTAHRIPQIAATANNLYFVCNAGRQGANRTYYIRRLPASASTWVAPANFSMTTASHWVGASVPQIGGSNIQSGYYYGCRAVMQPSDVERVLIPGLVNANSVGNAAVMYSDDLYTKTAGQAATWALSPIILGDANLDVVMSHMAAWSESDGSASMLVGAVTGLYGRDFLNVVYSEDGGETWMIAGADGETADYEISGGVAYDDSEVTSRQLAELADSTKTFSVQRIVYDSAGEKAYVSILIATGRGYLNSYPQSDDAACYILEVDLSNRATTGCTQTLHGPFFADELRNFGNGIQILDIDTLTLRLAVAMPEAATNPPDGYLDQPDGGPEIHVYDAPKSSLGTFDTWVQPPLVIELPSGGSPYSYEDAVVENIIHEWGYGYHQLFNGFVPVEGDADKIAALVGDQRVTGVPQAYHMGRIKILEASTS